MNTIRMLRFVSFAIWSVPLDGEYFYRYQILTVSWSFESDKAHCTATRWLAAVYFITLGCCTISWRMNGQKITSHSSVEVEYHSMAITTSDLAGYWSSFITWDFTNKDGFKGAEGQCECNCHLELQKNSWNAINISWNFL